MGQEPVHGRRAQDRNGNGDKENAKRRTILRRMGSQPCRKPKPPSGISRYRNSAHKPRKPQLTTGN